MPYGMKASVRPPSGSLCNICPVVLCKCSHWNGRIGNVETACLRHTSYIYMAVLKGKSKLAGNLSFCIMERRLCTYIHIDSQWRSLLMFEDAMLKSMHAEILMRRTPYNCSKRPIGLKNVHLSALAVSNKLPWQPECRGCPGWARALFCRKGFPVSPVAFSKHLSIILNIE